MGKTGKQDRELLDLERIVELEFLREHELIRLFGKIGKQDRELLDLERFCFSVITSPMLTISGSAVGVFAVDIDVVKSFFPSIEPGTAVSSFLMLSPALGFDFGFKVLFFAPEHAIISSSSTKVWR